MHTLSFTAQAIALTTKRLYFIVTTLLIVIAIWQDVPAQGSINLGFNEGIRVVPSGIQIIPDSSQPLELSAILDIRAENQGVLIPRMTHAQRIAIDAPANGLMVYQSDSTRGFYYFTDQTWEKVQDEDESVPIGTVIEWWRPNGSFPLPAGYAICDGAVVTDTLSPLYGMALPDLLDNFVKGVTSTADIGETSTGHHNHDVNPPPVTSSTDPPHTHTLSVNVTTTSAGAHAHTVNPDTWHTSYAAHNHQWSRFDGEPEADWHTFTAQGGQVEIMNWVDGLDGAGSDYFPVGVDSPSGTQLFYTGNSTHNHTIDIPATNTSTVPGHMHGATLTPMISSEGEHDHTLDIPSTTTSEAVIVPPFHGLLRIIRIK